MVLTVIVYIFDVILITAGVIKLLNAYKLNDTAKELLTKEKYKVWHEIIGINKDSEKQSIKEKEKYLTKQVDDSVEKGLVIGLILGVILAFILYMLTRALGYASTAMDISLLEGVTKTRATLARIGGGAIASGGLGIAGGILALIGLVVGTSLLVAGILAERRAEKNIEEMNREV